MEEWPAEESDDIAADIETEFMKWKLDGSLVEIVTDKDTRFIKKPWNPSDNNSSVDENAQKEEKAGKTKEESKEKNNSKENSEEITLNDLKENSFVRVTLKDDGSMTATEIAV